MGEQTSNADLQSQIALFEEKRQQVKRDYERTKGKGNKGCFFTAIGLVGGILLYISTDGFSWWYLAWAAFLAIGAHFSSKFIDKRKSYERQFKAEFIAEMVKRLHPELTYNPKSEIDQGILFDLGLISEQPNFGKPEDQLKGMVGKTAVYICEMDAIRRIRKGRKGKKYNRLFHGLYLQADFNKNFQGETYILPDNWEKSLGWLATRLQKLDQSKGQLVSLENQDFENLFAVYSSDEIEARYILSPKLMERLVKMHVWLTSKSQSPVKIMIRFKDGAMHLAIDWNQDFFEVSFDKTAHESADSIKTELSFCLGLVENLDLNTRIWGKS